MKNKNPGDDTTNVDDPVNPIQKAKSIVVEDLPEKVFTPQHCEYIKSYFDLYDKANIGSIAVRDVSQVIQLIGLNPTQENIKKILEPYRNTRHGKDSHKANISEPTVNFSTFIEIVQQFLDKEFTLADLKQAFKFFDTLDKYTLSVTILRHILTKYGEPLSKEEVDIFFDEAALFINNGQLCYDDVIQKFSPEWQNA